jgi:PAS domain S-box-containing protein
VWVTNAEGAIEFVNRAFVDMAGGTRESLGGDAWIGLVHPDDVAGVIAQRVEAWVEHSPYVIEARYRRADGEYRWMRASSQPRFDAKGAFLGYVGLAVDLTEARRAVDQLEAVVREQTHELQAAEETLRQAQKMEAIGQLTGGIAHDFNNLLTGILGSLSLMRRRLDEGRLDDLDRFMETASASANRAAALTHRLLAFARRQSLDPKPVDVGALISSMEELLHRTLGEQITLQVELGAGVWPVLADANQLESALLNLSINARDAMPDGGALRIATENIGIEDSRAPGLHGLAPGEYVAIAVSDTGIGMTPDVSERAFDPFFTTKPIGQGTGLGLSMIYGFVKQSNGHVRIDSRRGQGATVTLYLPRPVDAVASAPADHAPPAAAPRGAGETVLVVEDDAAVRLLVVETLRELGYRALQAPDGSAAQPILASAERIDLMITDVGLPGLNGRQLAEIARQARPGLKVLLVTGYAETAAVRSGFLGPGMEMMAKPFELDALAAKIREMVGGPIARG